jgi:hypothetical protein
MGTPTATRSTTLSLILDGLGYGEENPDNTGPAETYRLDFEQNFTLELQNMEDSSCRISARIFGLGKSLQVQEKQIQTALHVFSEVIEDLPPNVSPAIANQDNSLRLCMEISSTHPEEVMGQFHEFVSLAFAYQQTCFKQNRQ